jgi:hypothetical protein
MNMILYFYSQIKVLMCKDKYDAVRLGLNLTWNFNSLATYYL